MSSFDFMTSVKSVITQSPVVESLVRHPVSSRSFNRGRLSTAATSFSFRKKPTAYHDHPPLSQFSPWLITVAYPLGRYGVVRAYFQKIEVIGRQNLPLSGPLILAPTHRSRWDAVMVPYAAGYDITKRHLRFMVSADEVVGLQGWFIRRLGGFPVDTHRPAIATLRHGVDLLQQRETLVIFPEGDIFRESQVQPLKPGLARIALQAEASQPNLGVQIVPIHIGYSDPNVPWRSSVRIHIGQPLVAATYRHSSPKINAQQLTADLQQRLGELGNC